MTLYQCATCQKLFEFWKDLEFIDISGETGYYLCKECLTARTILAKDLNTSEVIG